MPVISFLDQQPGHQKTPDLRKLTDFTLESSQHSHQLLVKNKSSSFYLPFL